MANKIFDYNGSQHIDQVTGQALTNSGVEIKRGDLGLCGYIASGDSLTISGLSVDVINIVSWARGIGTLRVTVGATNTDIVLSDTVWTNTKSTVSLSSQTSVTITCTSGAVYVKKVDLFDIALTSYEESKIQEDFLHTFPQAEIKYYRNAVE